jgi:predicted RND superfamily exporter protein
VINRSINEVLSRTIITSGTVFLVLMALLLTGGVLLRDFALALLIGVVVDTYSSIFVASPIVYIWPTSEKNAEKPEAGGSVDLAAVKATQRQARTDPFFRHFFDTPECRTSSEKNSRYWVPA